MSFIRKIINTKSELMLLDNDNTKKEEALIVKKDMNKELTQKYLFWNYTTLEAQDICKHQIDAMEHWSRRIIDEFFKNEYGKDYFDYVDDKNQPLVKNELKKRVDGRIKDDPDRFPRRIDAIVLEDLEYFFCRPDLYKNHFKNVFEMVYTDADELRNVIEKISKVRNKISHGNAISQHEMEQCVCYTNDIINAFKEYYKTNGKEKEFNVPTFIEIRDCLGNCIVRDDPSYSWTVYSSCFKMSGQPTKGIQLRPGESYRLEIEVDSSFPEDFYEIEWIVYWTLGREGQLGRGFGKVIEFKANNASVSSSPTIHVTLTTKRKWHRFGHIKCDDVLEYHLGTVLPPIEDTY